MEGIFIEDLPMDESGLPDTISAMESWPMADTQDIMEPSYIQTEADNNYLQLGPCDLDTSFTEPTPEINNGFAMPDPSDFDNLEPDPYDIYPNSLQRTVSGVEQIHYMPVPGNHFIPPPPTYELFAGSTVTSGEPQQPPCDEGSQTAKGPKRARVDSVEPPRTAVPSEEPLRTAVPSEEPLRTVVFSTEPPLPRVEAQEPPQRLTRRGLPMRGSAMLVAARVASIVSWENATEDSHVVRNVANIIDNEISREVSRKRSRPHAPKEPTVMQSETITLDDSECDDGADGDSEMEQCSEPDEDEMDADFVTKEDEVEEICSSSDEEEDDEDLSEDDEYEDEDEDSCEEDEEGIVESESDDDTVEGAQGTDEIIVEGEQGTDEIIVEGEQDTDEPIVEGGTNTPQRVCIE